jgi:hypothetical protein
MAAPQNVIAQLKPGAASLQDIYSPGADRRARVNVTCACHTATDDIRLSIAPLGAGDATSQYVARDLAVVQDVPYIHEFYLEGTDMIRVYSTGGNVSFTVNGFEDDIPVA